MKTPLLSVIFVIVIFTNSCSKSIYTNILYPAEINIPAYIDSIIVINKSIMSNTNNSKLNEHFKPSITLNQKTKTSDGLDSMIVFIANHPRYTPLYKDD